MKSQGSANSSQFPIGILVEKGQKYFYKSLNLGPGLILKSSCWGGRRKRCRIHILRWVRPQIKTGDQIRQSWMQPRASTASLAASACASLSPSASVPLYPHQGTPLSFVPCFTSQPCVWRGTITVRGLQPRNHGLGLGPSLRVSAGPRDLIREP